MLDLVNTSEGGCRLIELADSQEIVSEEWRAIGVLLDRLEVESAGWDLLCLHSRGLRLVRLQVSGVRALAQGLHPKVISGVAHRHELRLHHVLLLLVELRHLVLVKTLVLLLLLQEHLHIHCLLGVEHLVRRAVDRLRNHHLAVHLLRELLAHIIASCSRHAGLRVLAGHLLLLLLLCDLRFSGCAAVTVHNGRACAGIS